MKNLCKFHNSTILSGFIVLLMITGFLFSCSRDEVKTEAYKDVAGLEKRTVEECVPKDEEQIPCFKHNEFIVIQLPLFDTCSFLIETEVFDCDNDEYYFGNFEILFEDCDSFDTWITNCQSSGGAFASCIAILNAQIMEALAIKMVTDENPMSTTTTVYFYGAACNQYCLYEKYDPRDEINFFSVGKLRCSDACCIHSYQLRKNGEVWEIFNSDVDQYGGIGCEYVLQVETCEEGALFTTTCIHDGE